MSLTILLYLIDLSNNLIYLLQADSNSNFCITDISNIANITVFLYIFMNIIFILMVSFEDLFIRDSGFQQSSMKALQQFMLAQVVIFWYH